MPVLHIGNLGTLLELLADSPAYSEWLCPRNAYICWPAVKEAQYNKLRCRPPYHWCLKLHEMICMRNSQDKKTEIMITCQNLGLADQLGTGCISPITAEAITVCFPIYIPFLVCMPFTFLSWHASGQVQLLWATSALWLSSYFQPKAPKEGQHSHHQA